MRAKLRLEIITHLAASARGKGVRQHERGGAPSRDLIGGSEGRDFDVKTARAISNVRVRRCMVPRMIRVVTQPLRSFPTESPPTPDILRPTRFTPSRARAPAMQISFSPRAPRFYMVLLSLLPRSENLFLRYAAAVDHSFRLSFLLLLPRASCRSFAVLHHPFVRSLSLSRPLPLLFLTDASLTVDHPLRLPHFHRAHPPPPVPFHSATPPPPSRPIQSPPRHPSFTASLAAYRLSFCHCGLFDILSTAVRTAEARLSRGRREILETNDGERKKSRTREPILVCWRLGVFNARSGGGHLNPADTRHTTRSSSGFE